MTGGRDRDRHRGDRRRRGRDDHRRGDHGRHKRRRFDGGGGGRRDRPARPPPPAPTPIGGAGSQRLVQLLTSVADVHARRTTDSSVPLQDNLRALSAAVAQKELGERPRVVAAQLALVAQASPLGAGGLRLRRCFIGGSRRDNSTIVRRGGLRPLREELRR